MSLRPQPIAPVPEETIRVARAAFPQGHPYLTFRDALGTSFQDTDFAPPIAPGGAPGPPALALGAEHQPPIPRTSDRSPSGRGRAGTY
jgi:hypothetical protein